MLAYISLHLPVSPYISLHLCSSAAMLASVAPAGAWGAWGGGATSGVARYSDTLRWG